MRGGRKPALVAASLLVATIALVPSPPVPAQTPEEALVAQIDAAEARVSSAESDVAAWDAKLQPAYERLTKAKEAFAARDAERNAILAQARALKNGIGTGTEKLDERIEKLEAELRATKALLARDPENDSYRREVQFLEYIIPKEKAKRDKLRRQLGTDDRRRRLDADFRRADDAYWTAYRELSAATISADVLEKLLAKAEAKLAEERSALAKLQDEAAARVGDPPPFLQSVEASAGGRRVYDARWVTSSELADERKAFVKSAVEFQKRQVPIQTLRRDEWLDLYVDASKDAIEALDAYSSAIDTQKWTAILTEIADAAVGVALDWGTMGPFGVFVQLGEKLWDWGKGAHEGRYDLPASTGGAPPPPYTGPAWANVAGSALFDRIKDGIKAVVEAAYGGGFQAVPAIRPGVSGPLTSTILWRVTAQELWIIPKFEMLRAHTPEPFEVRTVAGVTRRAVRDAIAVFEQSFRERSPAALKAGLARQLSSLPAKLRNLAHFSTWKQFVTEGWGVEGGKRRVAKGAAIGFAKDVVKGAVHEAARSKRLNAWAAFLEKDALALGVYRQFLIERDLLAFEIVQLKALQAYYAELLAEPPAKGRSLRVERDDVARGKDVHLSLRFSAAPASVRVFLAGTEVTGRRSGATWRGTAPIPANLAVAPLRVEATSVSGKELDARPDTEAAFSGVEKTWVGYEPGADDRHRIKLRDVAPGLSLVILVDVSGSMAEHGRIQAAKAAARSALRPGSLGPDDEVALWAFFDAGDIRLVVPFTRDLRQIVQAIQALEPSGATPLAASILRAGVYAARNARNERRVLMILSDGEETANGNPAAALRSVQQLGVETR